MKSFIIILITVFSLLMTGISFSKDVNKEIIIATTTSIVDTGLMDVLGEAFNKKTGYVIKPIAVGTGEALEMGKRGEADLVIVHNKKSEEEFIKEGYGLKRIPFMHNYFVIAGPKNDPVGVKKASGAVEAFKKIGEKKVNFVSRGDDSGTNKKELELWKKAKIKPEGTWYIQTGQGMAQTILIANEKDGYVLTDTGSFLSLKKQLNLIVLLEKDNDLMNVYSAILVNPQNFPSVNNEGAKAFLNFLLSKEGQKIIENFGKDKFGKALFIPDKLK